MAIGKEGKILLVSTFVALLLRIFLIHTGTLVNDMNIWVSWADRIVKFGFENFYNSWSDYLPSFPYILWILGKIKIAFLEIGLPLSNDVLFKMPAILADIGTAYIVYLLAQKYVSKSLAIFAFILYAFNPAIIANSAMWGQVDGLLAFFVVLAFWLFLERKIFWASIVLAFTALFKPTGIFIAPIVLIYLILNPAENPTSNKESAKNILYEKLKDVIAAALTFMVAASLIAIPFAKGQFPIGFILDRYKLTIDQYQYASLNAFNFWAMEGELWKKDLVEWNGISLMRWGLILFSIAALISLYFLIKRWSQNKKENFFNMALACSIVLAGAFDLLTRAHERHLLPMLPFLAIIAIKSKRVLVYYLASSAIYASNLYYGYIWNTEGAKEVFNRELIGFLSGMNILILGLLIFEVARKDKTKSEKAV